MKEEISKAEEERLLKKGLEFGMRYGGNPFQQTHKPSNLIRAAWAASALESFKLVTHAPAMVSNQELLSDLLADFLHLCRKRPEVLDFEAAIDTAKRNFQAEVKEEEGKIDKSESGA